MSRGGVAGREVTSRRLTLALVALAAGCGRGSEPEVTLAGEPPPGPPGCEPLRADSSEALCATWERARRGALDDMREVRCARRGDVGLGTRGRPVAMVLDMHYFAGARVGANARGESWVVLADGATHEVVGRLTDLFEADAGGDVGLQRLELLEPGADPVIVLEGVVRGETADACLARRTEHRTLVLCDRLAGGYRCAAESTGGTDTVEIAAAVDPSSSQYAPDAATRCAPVLARAGLSAGTARLESPRPARTLAFVGPGVYRVMPDGEPVILAERLASARCTTAF